MCCISVPKREKVYCPNYVTLDNNVLEYISQTKYLGSMFNLNVQDDKDMLRQMRNVFIRSNKLIRAFHSCPVVAKLELLKRYYTSFYCCYLWTAYKKSSFDKLLAASNNAYRRVLSQPFGFSNFETTIRKSACRCMPRLAKSTIL